ncbi:hypothetical protein [Gallaecimonas mangrovi]|uniref:hypothetical protein n=1 Tax=Gallaecimonas mangrovi TaxID=2291597 RepID=UPI0012600CF4|nr:hypothetical protein [Gallaecimonas mangrovi]
MRRCWLGLLMLPVMAWGCPGNEVAYFQCLKPEAIALCGKSDGSGLYLKLGGKIIGQHADWVKEAYQRQGKARYSVSLQTRQHTYLLFEHRQGSDPKQHQLGVVVDGKAQPCQDAQSQLARLMASDQLW